MVGSASGAKRSIDECDVSTEDRKRRRLNPIHAKRRGVPMPHSRRSHRNIPTTNTVDSESVLSSGIASPNHKFTFSYKITPTRATDSSRAMQRQKYPAFRRPTTRPLMRLAYGVPLVAATYEAHIDLVVRLASAMSAPWPIGVADMDIPAFPPGLNIPCTASRVAH